MQTNRHDKKHDIVNMDAPIALVEKIDGKMKVNDKAAEILSSCFVPVTVISIVGKLVIIHIFKSWYGYSLSDW